MAGNLEPINPLEVTISAMPCEFTRGGADQFKRTVSDYVDLLFRKARNYGELKRGNNNTTLEINEENVRSAAHYIAASFSAPEIPKWMTYVQVGEYVGVAIAGAGAGHLDNWLGIASFGIGLSAAVVLVVIRLTHSKEVF